MVRAFILVAGWALGLCACSGGGSTGNSDGNSDGGARENGEDDGGRTGKEQDAGAGDTGVDAASEVTAEMLVGAPGTTPVADLTEEQAERLCDHITDGLSFEVEACCMVTAAAQAIAADFLGEEVDCEDLRAKCLEDPTAPEFDCGTREEEKCVDSRLACEGLDATVDAALACLEATVDLLHVPLLNCSTDASLFDLASLTSGVSPERPEACLAIQGSCPGLIE